MGAAKEGGKGCVELAGKGNRKALKKGGGESASGEGGRREIRKKVDTLVYDRFEGAGGVRNEGSRSGVLHGKKGKKKGRIAPELRGWK